jgi:hypothetical protein
LHNSVRAHRKEAGSGGRSSASHISFDENERGVAMGPPPRARRVSQREPQKKKRANTRAARLPHGAGRDRGTDHPRQKANSVVVGLHGLAHLDVFVEPAGERLYIANCHLTPTCQLSLVVVCSPPRVSRCKWIAAGRARAVSATGEPFQSARVRSLKWNLRAFSATNRAGQG